MDTMYLQVKCSCIELLILTDILKSFRDENGEFFCFMGETQIGVTDMLNVNRGSHVAFPGETIMKEAKLYTERYLTKALENVGAFDKWALKKNIRGEVYNIVVFKFSTIFILMKI